jgi:UPF0716 protein FxsA
LYLTDLLNGLAVFVPLLLVVALVPLIELALLIRLYRATDLLTTVGLVLGTGLLGAAFARKQGFAIWRRIQTQLAQGKAPAHELVDAFLVVIAGAMLILPGILTDIAGLLLLLPPVRKLFRGWLARRLIPPGAARFAQFQAGAFSEARWQSENEIEAEYTVEATDPKESRLPKPPD